MSLQPLPLVSVVMWWFEPRDSWHFDPVVYGVQVAGKTLSNAELAAAN